MSSPRLPTWFDPFWLECCRPIQRLMMGVSRSSYVAVGAHSRTVEEPLRLRLMQIGLGIRESAQLASGEPAYVPETTGYSSPVILW